MSTYHVFLLKACIWRKRLPSSEIRLDTQDGAPPKLGNLFCAGACPGLNLNTAHVRLRLLVAAVKILLQLITVLFAGLHCFYMQYVAEHPACW